MALRICVTSGIPSVYPAAAGRVTGGPPRRAAAGTDAAFLRTKRGRTGAAWRGGATGGGRAEGGGGPQRVPVKAGGAGASCGGGSGKRELAAVCFLLQPGGQCWGWQTQK